MTVYLIGPSGVGKTACARAAAKAFPFVHIELDSLCHGHEYDWPACSLEFAKQEYAPRDQLQIVDIGAGTQTLPELREYLSLRPERVVLVWGPESEVIRRNPLGPDRPLDEYHATEYASRQDLYAIALHRINVAEKAEQEASQLFIDYLVRIFTHRWTNLRAA